MYNTKNLNRLMLQTFTGLAVSSIGFELFNLQTAYKYVCRIKPPPPPPTLPPRQSMKHNLGRKFKSHQWNTNYNILENPRASGLNAIQVPSIENKNIWLIPNKTKPYVIGKWDVCALSSLRESMTTKMLIACCFISRPKIRKTAQRFFDSSGFEASWPGFATS